MINLLKQEPTVNVNDWMDLVGEGGAWAMRITPYIAPLGNGETPQPGILNGTLFFKVVYY